MLQCVCVCVCVFKFYVVSYSGLRRNIYIYKKCLENQPTDVRVDLIRNFLPGAGAGTCTFFLTSTTTPPSIVYIYISFDVNPNMRQRRIWIHIHKHKRIATFWFFIKRINSVSAFTLVLPPRIVCLFIFSLTFQPWCLRDISKLAFNIKCFYVCL